MFVFKLQAFFVILATIAIVSAVPVDESIAGEVYGPYDSVNFQEPNEFFKLKKLKKLLKLG